MIDFEPRRLKRTSVRARFLPVGSPQSLVAAWINRSRSYSRVSLPLPPLTGQALRVWPSENRTARRTRPEQKRTSCEIGSTDMDAFLQRSAACELLTRRCDDSM